MYANHVALREEPFNLTPDPRFFYANRTCREAYARLVRAVEERRGLVVMTGEAGTGKTTLLRMLMLRLEGTARVAYLSYTPPTFDELLVCTCHQLGIDAAGEGRLPRIEALRTSLLEERGRGRMIALLIDEAQNLGMEVLEALPLLWNGQPMEQGLQVVLVGQPSLESALATPRLRELRYRSVECRLDRLEGPEVADYIAYRVQASGAAPADLFDQGALERIAHYSRGVPASINIICHNALGIAGATAAAQVSAAMVEKVVSDLGWTSDSERNGRMARATPGNPVGPPSPEAKTSAGIARRRRPHRQLRLRRPAWAGPVALTALVVVGAVVALHASGVTGRIAAPVTDRIAALWTVARMDAWAPASKPVIRAPAPGEVLVAPGVHDPGASSSPAPPEPSAAPEGPARAAVDSPEGPAEVARDVPERMAEVARDVPETPAEVGRDTPAGPPERPAPSLPPREIQPPRTAVERVVGSASRGRSIVTRPGATIADIAFKTYGGYSILAIDLIQEFNPHVDNLSAIQAGEQLRLPRLDAETLIRRQRDGSYRLILASFLSNQAAERERARLRGAGYEAAITVRTLARNMEVHRLELTGLATREIAERAWKTGLANCWVHITQASCDKRANR
jgi:general secretion pathway protein A